MSARYSFGGDEHVCVEVAAEMSLGAFFRARTLCRALKDAALAGVSEICPANASFMVRFDPDVIAASDLVRELQAMETVAELAPPTLRTRLVEVPVLYDDPWTRETGDRFRERRQDPGATDLAYAARANGYRSEADFLAAHAGSPWFVSMVGFVAGLPFMYQMVERERQIQVPKYLRPRTDTPKQTVGHGGCFGCIYSVRGAGGYQMFGVTPMPIYDPSREVGHLRETMTFFRPGDVVRFRPVDREGYDDMVRQVGEGRFEPAIRPIVFDLDAFEADVHSYNAALLLGAPDGP